MAKKKVALNLSSSSIQALYSDYLLSSQDIVNIGLELERLETSPNMSEAEKLIQFFLRNESIWHCIPYESNNVLLGVLYSRKSTLEVFQYFPNVMVIDTTFNTNNVNSPLCKVVGIDSNNSIIPIAYMFMPNQKLSSFLWLMNEGLPTLFGSELCSKVSLILTDGDRNEIDAIEDAISNHFVNAHHRLCFWHLVVKGMVDHIGLYHNETELRAGLLLFLKYICKEASDVTEMNNVKQSLKEFLEKAAITNERKTQINSWLTTSIYPNLRRIAHFHFKKVRGFNRISSRLFISH
jgi:hypothetical protein